MIVLREISREERLKVKSILEKENIKDNLSRGIIYILLDDNIIIGVGKVTPEHDYGILEYIVVDPKHRGLNLGDALLRSLLFKAESMGLKKIFYYSENDYLFKKGFMYNKEKYTNFYKMFLDIQDFFNKGCCGDEDEV